MDKKNRIIIGVIIIIIILIIGGVSLYLINRPAVPDDCSSDIYNCNDFSTQAEAQQMFEKCGGKENDIHRLDNDGDGRVCESLL